MSAWMPGLIAADVAVAIAVAVVAVIAAAGVVVVDDGGAGRRRIIGHEIQASRCRHPRFRPQSKILPKRYCSPWKIFLCNGAQNSTLLFHIANQAVHSRGLYYLKRKFNYV